MEARVVGESFSAIRSRDPKEEYGCVRRTCSGALPLLSTVLERVRFPRRRQSKPRRARIKHPPTAPTITPTRAPVERPLFECEVDPPVTDVAPVAVGIMVVVATYVVPVGVDT